MRMIIIFNGTEFNYDLNRFNLRKGVAGSFPGVPEEEISENLVMYDEKTNTVTVDEKASDSYAKYAAIHECICCGRYKELAPDVDDPNKRCGAIDLMLIQNMPESDRETYKTKRIEMFKTLIEGNLNPPMEPLFRESITMLESI